MKNGRGGKCQKGGGGGGVKNGIGGNRVFQKGGGGVKNGRGGIGRGKDGGLGKGNGKEGELCQGQWYQGGQKNKEVFKLLYFGSNLPSHNVTFFSGLKYNALRL